MKRMPRNLRRDFNHFKVLFIAYMRLASILRADRGEVSNGL
jgi:hypothetical protein